MRTKAILVSALLASCSAAIAAEPVSIRPAAGPLAVGGSFGFTDHPKKLRRAISGIACTGPGLCLLAFDEGAEARMIELDGDDITATDTPLVLAGGGEVDAESAAFDGTHLYVSGSHAVKRGTCEENLASRTVLRADVDATGRPGTFVPAKLWPVMQGLESLKDHLGKCLSDADGVDIEALAAAGGRLYFGFRGPAAGGSVPIFSVDAEAFFAGGDPSPSQPIDVAVGSGRGLRDMAAVGDGFLLLAGPDDDPAHADAGWVLLAWDGKGAATRPVARLDLAGMALRTNVDGCDDQEIKPEALYVDAATDRVLVLSDGLCDGGPMWFQLPPPARN